MFRFILLGAVQGLTEFLPVSSSAHLIFVSTLGFRNISLQEMVLLHVGTLLALFWFFRREILKELSEFARGNYLFGLKVIFAVLITVLVALPLEPIVNGLTAQPRVVSGILLGMGLLLFAMKFYKRDFVKGIYEFSFKHAIVLGVLQGLAVIPGISRSGITIIGLLLLGYEPGAAFLLSFLIGIPAIVGAALLELPKISLRALPVLPLLIGLFSSYTFGIIALLFLRKSVVAKKIYLFGIYCAFAAVCVNVYLTVFVK